MYYANTNQAKAAAAVFLKVNFKTGKFTEIKISVERSDHQENIPNNKVP